MIVKNEELVLDNCLKNVHDLVDEIIIVDTGSTDKTKEIAKKYTDKIYDFKWIDDFSAARNFSFSKATKDYILWLDADDVLPEDQREGFKKLKESLDGSADMYTMVYIYAKDANGKPSVIQRNYRLMKRENNYKWESPIHEYIQPYGKIINTEVTVVHNKLRPNEKNRNLKIFNKMINDGYEFNEREKYCYAMELHRSGNIPKAIDEFEKFKKQYSTDYEKHKWYLYDALIELSDCYKKIGNDNKELDTLFFILKNQMPTIVCLNKIADNFRRKEKYKEAIYWFNLSANCEDDNPLKDNELFKTYLAQGFCHYQLKQYDKAYEVNEKAGKINPQDQSYLKNKEIYQSLIK